MAKITDRFFDCIMNYQYRRWQQKDITVICELEQTVTAFPWSEKHYKDCWHAQYQGWVALSAKKIIGFILIQQIIDEYHILNIAVANDYQRQGIGTQLFNTVITQGKENAITTLLLEVRTSNDAAQHLYYRLGFNEIAVRKAYYPGKTTKEDAILMGLYLS